MLRAQLLPASGARNQQLQEGSTVDAQGTPKPSQSSPQSPSLLTVCPRLFVLLWGRGMGTRAASPSIFPHTYLRDNMWNKTPKRVMPAPGLTPQTRNPSSPQVLSGQLSTIHVKRRKSQESKLPSCARSETCQEREDTLETPHSAVQKAF